MKKKKNPNPSHFVTVLVHGMKISLFSRGGKMSQFLTFFLALIVMVPCPTLVPVPLFQFVGERDKKLGRHGATCSHCQIVRRIVVGGDLLSPIFVTLHRAEIASRCFFFFFSFRITAKPDARSNSTIGKSNPLI